MDEILNEFLEDIGSIRESIILFERLRKLNQIDETNVFVDLANEDNKNTLENLVKQTKRCHTYFPVIQGTLVLYIAGRFENYVRTLFEEACGGIASKCGNYESLPKDMKANLIKYTAEVISSPRKYNHGEGGVKTFIKNLSDNLTTGSVQAINYQCLSITSENMRSITIQELFERCGVKKLWETLSEQTTLQMYYKSTDKAFVVKEARSELDELMNLRNNIAHPSNGITWPDSTKIEKYIDFLISLATTLKDVIKLYVYAS